MAISHLMAGDHLEERDRPPPESSWEGGETPETRVASAWFALQELPLVINIIIMYSCQSSARFFLLVRYCKYKCGIMKSAQASHFLPRLMR